jgi:hypothetical protein
METALNQELSANPLDGEWMMDLSTSRPNRKDEEDEGCEMCQG